MKRPFLFIALIAVMVLSACAPQAAATETAAQKAPAPSKETAPTPPINPPPLETLVKELSEVPEAPEATATNWKDVDPNATFATPETLATLVPSETPTAEPTIVEPAATPMSAEELFTQETERVKAEVRVVLDQLYKFEKPVGEGITVAELTKDGWMINDQPANKDDVKNLRNTVSGPGKVYIFCDRVKNIRADQKKVNFLVEFI